MTKLENSRFAQWANMSFKLILLALVVVWIIFPPQHPKEVGVQQPRFEASPMLKG